MSIAKEKYIAFTQKNYVPIFYRHTYLDIVCDAPWDVTLYEEAGEIKAVYIYMLKHKFFLNYIVQPQFCPYTGPLFFNPKNEAKAFAHLLELLPKHQIIIQDYFHDIPEIDGFIHTQYKKHTYVINSNVDLDLHHQNLSPTHRRIIRKAQKELTYEEEKKVDLFLDFVSTTFQKRNKKAPNDPIIFKKLDKELADRGLRKIVKCTNNQKEVVAMSYFMNDEKWTYNFANSVVDDYRHYGMNLILWNEIQATLKSGRSFDFEGSVIPGIDAFFKRFKGTKTMYPSQYRCSNKMVDILVKMKRSKDKI